MLKRPLILKLFALFLVIDPLLRIAFIALERDFTFFAVLNRSLNLGFIDFFNFWFLFPLSGVLLLSVKLYSYLVFLLIQLYGLYFHINYEPFSWPYLTQSPSFMAYIMMMINMTMVLYFLLPRSREIFFNKNLRWWERGSRYTINEKCRLIFSDQKTLDGTLCDLSFGGALLELSDKVELGDLVHLHFNILDKNISLSVQVVRFISDKEGVAKIGVQFLFEKFWKKIQLHLIMLSISKMTAYRRYR